MKSVSIEIEYRRTADLKPYGNNARTHSKKQVRQIAESIQRFGFTNPILISDRDEVIAGHGRLPITRASGSSDNSLATTDAKRECAPKLSTDAGSSLMNESDSIETPSSGLSTTQPPAPSEGEATQFQTVASNSCLIDASLLQLARGLQHKNR